MTPFTALIALIIDATIGWPDQIFRRIRHPVVWFGWLINRLDNRMNHGANRARNGMIASLVVIAAATIPAVILQSLLGPVIAGILAWPLVAARSLYDHVKAVQIPLEAGDLPAARQATAQIVGRDVSAADEASLSRASIESLAENASDGVIAPLFWALIGGLPGIAAYKAINTLDSMIGHRTPKHEEFGRFAAKLDDLVNWIPARLTALLITAAAGTREPWRAARREAHKHRSPNAGWPEAAMANALGVRLSGPRHYGNQIANEPWLNEGARDPKASDFSKALALYRRSVITFGAGLIILTPFL